MKNKILFIHINKCGGTSIKRALNNLPNVYIPNNNNIKNLIKNGIYSEYFKFSITRHPIDRFKSFIKMCIRDGKDYVSIDNVIDIITSDSKEVTHLNMFNFPNYAKRHTLPMSHPFYGVIVDGKNAMDKLFRLETISEDWKEICSIVGIPPSALKIHNSSFSGDILLSDSQLARLNGYYQNDFLYFQY